MFGPMLGTSIWLIKSGQLCQVDIMFKVKVYI